MHEIHESFQQKVILENFSVLDSLLFTALFFSSISYLTEVWRTEQQGGYTNVPSWVGPEEFVP